jgi:hypothetical protein
MPSSELGRENLSRVAASAGEIKAVLFKDAGLMVALKYWVAKDATEHGQIISESDLTNDAIFERLEEDAQFRSVATALVQRYGYLLPKLNPESDVAREHELLVQERTKWLAQNQEEELANARRRRERDLQNAKSCDPEARTSDCAAQTFRIPHRECISRPLRARVPTVNPGEESRPANPPARRFLMVPRKQLADGLPSKLRRRRASLPKFLLRWTIRRDLGNPRTASFSMERLANCPWGRQTAEINPYLNPSIAARKIATQ